MFRSVIFLLFFTLEFFTIYLLNCVMMSSLQHSRLSNLIQSLFEIRQKPIHKHTYTHKHWCTKHNHNIQ